MGIGPGFRLSPGPPGSPIPKGNPVPYLFDLGRIQEVGPHTVALIRYHGVRNYEGLKIIVYLDTPAKTVREARSIDPHFTDAEVPLRPFARFEPTPAGWAAAVTVAEAAVAMANQEDATHV